MNTPFAGEVPQRISAREEWPTLTLPQVGALVMILSTPARLAGSYSSHCALLGHPTRHNTNPNLLVDGVPVVLGARHAKIRRDRYRTSRS